jgi:hypothetical protein
MMKIPSFVTYERRLLLVLDYLLETLVQWVRRGFAFCGRGRGGLLVSLFLALWQSNSHRAGCTDKNEPSNRPKGLHELRSAFCFKSTPTL